MRKCFVCGKDVMLGKVFINQREVRHYYCKSCAKRYLIKIKSIKGRKVE